MESNDQNIAYLSQALAQTTESDPSKRVPAENFLSENSKKQGFPILLLKIIELPANDAIRISGAIYFKNFIKLNWANKEDSKISSSDREQIKAVIVTLMLSSAPKIQKQLQAAVELISECDFPHEWKSLLPELISKLNTQDFKIIIGVLRTSHAIFKRYRHKMKSSEVLLELKYVLELFQAPMLQLFQATATFIDHNLNTNNPDILIPTFKVIKLLLGIFYSLNVVDLPEYFEDHMNEWMEMFRKFLLMDIKYPQLIGEEDDEKPSLLHKIQAAVCQNLNLYIGKYEEEFLPFYETFLKDVWSLLLKVNKEARFDQLVANAIQFLGSASTSVHYGIFIKEPGTLRTLCESIVIPNLRLRDVDLEMFEDHPVEYIRRDIEGSDADTRRKSATELVKGLRKHFESEVTQICSTYINNMLQLYNTNPQANWLAKDVTIYLVTALAVKGATQSGGITQINQLVPIMDFFASQILPELQNDNPPAMVLKADALRFVATFRQQFPKDVFNTIFSLLIKNLTNTNFVVQTYAANCIDKLLLVRDGTTLRFGKEDIKPYLDVSLINLFRILEIEASKENDYVMRAIMRIVSVAKEDILPLASKCMTMLVNILAKICKNPTNPTFNHYLFETIAAIIKSNSQNPQAVMEFERQLFEPFQIILQADVLEFAPYVFQILALQLEVNPTGGLTSPYKTILPFLLAPALWERTGNIPALVRLLQAYCMKGASDIVAGQYLEPLLGVFQKLLASRVNDHEGFYILESIVQYFSPSDFSKHLPVILTLIFSRIQREKTLKLIKSFLVFMSLFIGKHGPNFVIEQIDLVQPNLFLNILTSLWIPNITKVNGLIERKMVSVAMTKLLTDCPKMIVSPYVEHWGNLFKVNIEVLEGHEDESVPTDTVDIDVEEGVGYTTAFSQLIQGSKSDVDLFPDINSKEFLVLSLHKTSKQVPGTFSRLIGTVPMEVQAIFMNYCRSMQLPEPFII